MGTLEMEFRGMCMHLRPSMLVPLPDDVGHRVVAINADQGARTERFGELPPHETFMEVDTELGEYFGPLKLEVVVEGVFRMHGTRITVGNAKNQPLVVEMDPLVPHLTTYAPDMVLRPDLAQKEPQHPDCVIDISHGHVKAHAFPKGGIFTRWTVETEGHPELVFERPGHKTAITIPTDEVLTVRIRNGTPSLCDEKNDFALYYLAAVGGINAQTYAGPLPGQAGSATYVDTTTSCSNSQYP